jgi:hypothetical protein
MAVRLPAILRNSRNITNGARHTILHGMHFGARPLGVLANRALQLPAGCAAVARAHFSSVVTPSPNGNPKLAGDGLDELSVIWPDLVTLIKKDPFKAKRLQNEVGVRNSQSLLLE